MAGPSGHTGLGWGPGWMLAGAGVGVFVARWVMGGEAKLWPDAHHNNESNESNENSNNQSNNFHIYFISTTIYSTLRLLPTPPHPTFDEVWPQARPAAQLGQKHEGGGPVVIRHTGPQAREQVGQQQG